MRDATTSRDLAKAARVRLSESYRWEILAAQTDEVYARAETVPQRSAIEPAVIPPRGINLLRDFA